MQVRVYSSGVCLDMGLPISSDSTGRKHKRKKRRGGKRAKLTGKYSAASFRRMREYCITHDCMGDCWGMTLTVPGLSILPNDQFKRIVHKLSVFCNHWEIPVIWRCELQQRGQPHLHLVLYGSVKDCSIIMRQWHVLMFKTGDVLNVEDCDGIKDLVSINRAFVNGSQHMYDVQKLQGDYRAWRYLVAHASKGKREQLGWAGRQWGVICRNKMFPVESFDVSLSDRAMYALRRWVRRCSYRRIGNYGRHFVLISPREVLRMINYLKDDYFEAPF